MPYPNSSRLHEPQVTCASRRALPTRRRDFFLKCEFWINQIFTCLLEELAFQSVGRQGCTSEFQKLSKGRLAPLIWQPTQRQLVKLSWVLDTDNHLWLDNIRSYSKQIKHRKGRKKASTLPSSCGEGYNKPVHVSTTSEDQYPTSPG